MNIIFYNKSKRRQNLLGRIAIFPKKLHPENNNSIFREFQMGYFLPHKINVIIFFCCKDVTFFFIEKV